MLGKIKIMTKLKIMVKIINKDCRLFNGLTEKTAQGKTRMDCSGKVASTNGYKNLCHKEHGKHTPSSQWPLCHSGIQSLPTCLRRGDFNSGSRCLSQPPQVISWYIYWYLSEDGSIRLKGRIISLSH